MDKKSLWTGIGIGAVTGLTAGFIIGNQVTKRAVRKDLPRIQHDAYIKGKKDAKREQQNDYIVVESSDINEIQKAIDKHFSEDKKETSKNEEKPPEAPIKNVDSKPVKKESPSLGEDTYAKKTSQSISERRYRLHGDYIVFIGAAGTELYYPKTIMINPADNLPYDDMHIRKNFREYETDSKKLMVIWNAMGWGNFEPQPNDACYDVDINDWDVSIGDESQLGDEPEEKTKERRKYLEKLEIYKNDPNYKPRIVTKKDFDEENYLKQIQVDYYDVDNKFADSQDLDKDFDAITMLGTNDGKALFSKKVITEEDPDPDVIYVENFHMNSIMEITRYHKAFAGLKDGTAFV